MVVGDADRANVVPLGEEQFENHLAIFPQALAVRFHVHALGDLGGAGRQELVHAGDFHETQAAGADIGDAFHVAQRRDFNARFLGSLEEGCALARADLFAVNR